MESGPMGRPQYKDHILRAKDPEKKIKKVVRWCIDGKTMGVLAPSINRCLVLIARLWVAEDKIWNLMNAVIGVCIIRNFNQI